MQEQQFNRLIDMSLDTRITKSGTIQKKIETIQTDNKEALEQVKLPNYERIPSAEELEKFRQYAAAYKKQIPNASKREVRKAVQNHFHIRIYK